MKKKKIKPSLKIALASTIAVTSAAAIIYNTPETLKTVAVEGNENNKFILDVQKIDKDTIKVSLDNIEDIPKAIQFSIQLDEKVVIKEENGTPIIKDLVNTEKSNDIITDYTYNKKNNTVDVLITSTKDLPKEGNKVDIFELDIEKATSNDDKKYTVTQTKDSVYKYISTSNKEYVRDVEIANNDLSINTAPTIKKKDGVNYIEMNIGDTITKEELNKYVEVYDADGDSVTLEMRDNKESSSTIDSFGSNKEAGIYDLYVIANDGTESSEALNIQVKINAKEDKPTITKDGKELQDIVIKSGEFNTIEALTDYLMLDVEAKDIDGIDAELNIEFDRDVVLNPKETEVYLVTYKAKDSQKRETIKQIALKIRVNKAPTINGVIDHTLTVGDEFDPREGVTVEDDYDRDIELQVYYNENIEIKLGEKLDTSNPGEYVLTYIAEDSDGEATEAVSKITINSKNNPNPGDGEDENKPGSGDNENGEDDSNINKPGDDSTIVIPEFIENIIDNKVIEKVTGEATIENPLVLDIKNVSIDEFNNFINKLKELNPTLIKKYSNDNYTIYKIKLKNNNSLIEKILSFGKLNEEGIIEIRVANTLDNEIEFKTILNDLLNISLEDDNNQSEDEKDPSEEVIIEGEDTGSYDKLPITGQESILGILGILAISIGGVIYKRKK